MSRTVAERLWAKVNKNGPNGCWLWTGSNNGSGYGRIYVQGSFRPTHRVAYELAVGVISDGFQIDHLCRVTLCINPAHLEAVTPQVNVLRGDTVSAKRAAQTHCLRGHEFTIPNTRIDKLNRRVCRECDRLRAIESRRETRANA